MTVTPDIGLICEKYSRCSHSSSVCFYPAVRTVQFASHTNRIEFCQTYYSLTQEEAVNFGVKEDDSN